MGKNLKRQPELPDVPQSLPPSTVMAVVVVVVDKILLTMLLGQVGKLEVAELC